MYRDVVKRVTAWVLVLCMMGSIPDFSLWAASTGNGNHSYALEDGGENMEIINTNATSATITNTFTMDSNDSSTLHTQTLTSVSFALNATMNQLGDSGRYINTADYTITVTGTKGSWSSEPGEYHAADTVGKGRFTVNVDPDDTIQFGPGEKVTVAVAVSNVQWIGDDGAEDTTNHDVSFRVANRTDGNKETSTYNGTTLSSKVACIRMTTVETASADATTGIAFKAGAPEAVAVGETVQLGLDFTPVTANDRNVTWTSSDTNLATVDSNGTVTGHAQGQVTIRAALSSNPTGIYAEHTLYVCKKMDSADININSGAGIADQTYTGQALAPSVGVFDGTKQLTPGTHYSYDFDDNVDAGTAKMVLTGRMEDFYIGTKEVPFTIASASLNSANVHVSYPAKAYTLPTEQQIEDYRTSSGNVSATEEDVLLSWILKGDSTLGIQSIQITYKPYESQPANQLDPDNDYEIVDKNFVAGAGAYIEIRGIGNYQDTRRISIPITKSITDSAIKVTDADTNRNFHYSYTGEVIEPKVKITDGAQELKEGTDYQINGYFDDENGTTPATVDAGDKYIQIQGLGAYATDDGAVTPNPVTRMQKYEVAKVNVNSNSVKIDLPKQVPGFDQDLTKLQLEVTFNGKPLVKGTDYDVAVAPAANGDPSLYDITITGKGNFMGSVTLSRTTGTDINTVNFAFQDATVDTNGVDYMGGQEVRPAVVLTNSSNVALRMGTDYELTYSNNRNASVGTNLATVKITGIGNYAGVMTREFRINPIALDATSIRYDYSDVLPFNARLASGALVTDVKPTVKITYTCRNSNNERVTYTLVEGTDYELADYQNYQAAGNADFDVNAKGDNFTGTKNLTYTIEKRDVNVETLENGNVLSVGWTNTPTYTGTTLTEADLGIYVRHNNATFPVPTPPSSNTALQQFFADNFTTNILDIGNGQILIQVIGKGSYSGTWSRTVSVQPYNISGSRVEFDPIAPEEYKKDGDCTPSPTVKITNGPGAGTELQAGVDYTVSYENNAEVGNARVIITGRGNYTGTNSTEFIIYKDLAKADYADTIALINPIPDQYYTGSPIELKPEDVVLGDILKNNSGRRVIEKNRYTLSYTHNDNTEVGQATVTVTGGGIYYKNSREFTFNIVRNNMGNTTVTLDSQNYTYTGSPIEPSVTVEIDGKPIDPGDYVVTYDNNTNAGARDSDNPPKVLVVGTTTHFSGVKTVTFDIIPKTLEENASLYTYTYPKAPDKIEMENGVYNPIVAVYDVIRSRSLVKGRDYTVTCRPADGENGYLTFTGIGNYQGSVRFSVLLDKEPISPSLVDVSFTGGRPFTYTGKSVVEDPNFNLQVRKRDTGALMTYGTDYRIVPVNGYDNSQFVNYDGGKKIEFQIEFIGEEFQGFLSGATVGLDFSFIIEQKDINDSDVNIVVPNQEAGVRPTVSITYNGMTLIGGTDYDYEPHDYSEADFAAGKKPYVVITAKAGSNYKGTKTVYYTTGASLLAADVTILEDGYDIFDSPDYGRCFIYQGEEIKPRVDVKLGGNTLVANRDYEVTYQDNVDSVAINASNRGKVIVTGTGSYAGQITKEFTIAGKNAANNEGGSVAFGESLPIKIEFTGSAVNPDLKVVFTNKAGHKYDLVPGKDYTIDGSAPVDVGATQSLTISYIGNFSYRTTDGVTRQEASCTIVPKDFKDAEVETDPGDIYVAWENAQDEYSYEGQPLQPRYVVKDIKRNPDGSYREDGTLASLASAYTLKANTDYTIRWRNNDRPGTAELTLTGRGNYKDTQSITRTFKIKGTLNYANIDFANPDYPNDNNRRHQFNYTGKPIRPELKVWFGDDESHPLKAGRSANDPDADYWCEYPLDCTNCGTGKQIIIHGINAYSDSGDFTKTYDIVQRDINDAEVETLGSFSYTGQDIKPVPKLYYGGVLLRPDEDYICTWESSCSKVNDESDPYYTVTIVANPAGNFSGSYTKKEITYKIGDSFTEENGITVNVLQDEYEYIGETIIPRIQVTDRKYADPLVRGRDYEIAIDEGNPYYINAGKKTFRVYGIEDTQPYVGDITKEFTITQVNLSDASRIRVELENPQNHRYQYYGRPHEPQPVVTWTHPTGTGATTQTVLSADNGDYTYSYANNTDAGTATVKVSEGLAQFEGVLPNFTGSKDVNFTILPIQVTEDSSLLKITDLNDWIYTYTGQPISPNVVIEYDGRTLTEGKDFEINTANATNIGDAQATILFKGNYEGRIVKPFKIVKRSVVDSKVNITIAGGETHKYTGERILPEVQITYDGAALTRGTDYTLEYGENRNAGAGEIKITGINNYDGETTVPFVISPIQINSGDVEIVCDSGVIKNGQPAEPEFTVYWVQEDGTKLKVYAVDDQEAIASGRELAFTYRYTNNTTIGGTGHLEVTGTNNFTGTKVVDFFIGADIEQFIDSIEWPNGAPNLTFNNTPQKPGVKVNLTNDANASSLRENRDYEIVYEPVSDNGDADVTNAGDYKVFIKGIGTYAGRTNELSYSIAQRNISLVTFTVPDAEFTGSAIQPSITARDEALGLDLEEATAGDLTRARKANAYTTAITGDTVNVGRVSVAISAVGNGNYTGSVTRDFNITPKELVGGSVTISPNLIEDQIYTGGAVTPKLTIVDTARNAVGEAVSQGQGTYELTASDCTITYSNNIYPGEATVTIVARGNYTGRLSKEFKINADLSMANVAPIPPQAYTGSPVTPALTVTLAGKTLVVNRDYTVTYQNNVNRGVATATITATPLGGYTGEKTVTFEIGRDLSGAQVRAVADAFTYTGNAIVPQIAVVYGSETLRPGVDYSVAYANNVNVGEATVTVTGQGVYSGRVVRTFRIVAKNIARCGFGSVETKLYNGQATTQNFAVTDGGRTLVLNQDYRILYVNNSKPGTATIQITGLGNYGGVKTIRYNIEVKPMTAISLTGTTKDSVSLSWTPVDSAEGYAVYNDNNRLVGRTTGTSYTVSQLSPMKSYSFRVRPYVVSDGATYFGDFSNEVSAVTNPPTPSGVKVKAGKKQAKVSWKKINGVSGYEVYRSTKKSSGYKKVTTLKSASKTSYTNKKLKTKKKYYFKVRAYKTVNGKKLYSAYSSPKQVKVK